MARLFALLVASLTCAAGCSRLRFTISLGPEDPSLREYEVRADSGARDDKIAVIDVRGLIADSQGGGLLWARPNPVDEYVARLERAAKDPLVKAVILRINSPGGTVTASDVMHEHTRRFGAETGKPVVAHLGEVAASGGYYLALAADEIVAQPTSLTGSIGVIFPTLNVSEGLGMIGVRARSVTSGPNKALASPLEPMHEEHYAILQGIVDEEYSRFRALVVARRPGLDASNVGRATDGRIVTGAEAVRLGLADAAGSLNDAFDRAKALAGIDTARMVKYISAGAARPRTPYAEATPAPATGADPDSLNLGALGEWAGVLPPGAYYLWAPGGG